MKKSVSLLAAAAMLAAAVSCGSKSSSDAVNKEVFITAENTENKTELKVAMLSYIEELEETVNAFNARSDKYSVSVCTYVSETGDDESSESINDSISQLNLDILAGNSPDIIIAEPQDINRLRRKGYLADLTPLMDSGCGVRKEDFLPNVIESLENDGEINAVFNCFDIPMCGLAKSSVLDSSYTNWTYDQAIETFKTLPNTYEYFQACGAYSDFVRFFTYNLASDCIDYEELTCDFGKYLPEALGFIMSIPEGENGFMPNRSGITGYVAEDTALIDIRNFIGIDVTFQYASADFNGEDMTYLGLPSASGAGPEVDIHSMCSIMDNSENKEGAWEFISEFFQLGPQTRCNGIPVTKNAVNELAYNTKASAKDSIRQPVKSFSTGEYMSINDEAIEKYVDYVSSLKLSPFIDKEVRNIISEECSSVLHGEKSIDEAVADLNSRIGLYLSEKN